MSMHFVCLINPFAGGKQGRILYRRLEQCRQQGLFKGSVIELQPALIGLQVQQALQAECILIGGGDGTVSAVLQHIGTCKVRLGLLPLGTANDLARELNIPQKPALTDPEFLVDSYSHAPVKQLAVWRVEFGPDYHKSLRFCNYLSLGFDGFVVQDVIRWRKKYKSLFQLGGKTGNRLAYGIAGLLNWRRGFVPSAIIRDLQQEGRAFQVGRVRNVLFPNIRAVMGLGVSNLGSDGFDRRIELVKVGSLFNLASMLSGQLLGRFRPLQLACSEKWEVEPFGRPAVQIDGEACPELAGGKLRIVFDRTVEICSGPLLDGG